MAVVSTSCWTKSFANTMVPMGRANNAEEYFNYGEAMAKLNEIVVPFAKALAAQ